MSLTHCRVCGSAALHPVLDLGHTPLANRVLPPDALCAPEPTYPLAVVFCGGCTLVQITESVPPEELFGQYVYFSGVSSTVVASAAHHAADLIARRGLNRESLVVEAASNDGYQLQFFRDAGVPVLGVEPARNIAAVANDAGIPTRPVFFDRQTGHDLAHEGVRADVVLAKNVLAHVPDPVGFIAGIAAVLAPDGIAEIEVPWVVDLVDHVEFDTIYHEHLSYFSLHALHALATLGGLVLTDVRHLPLHGGTLRITLAHQPDADGLARVRAALDNEQARGVHTLDFYAAFADRVQRLGVDLRCTLEGLRAQGKRIAAYGASAKGATLLNTFGLGPLLDYVVDRAPAKQGLYTPGTRLPIHPTDHLCDDGPDYALLLTWNHRDEILGQQQAYRAAGGRFIVPVPTVEIV